MVLFVSDGAELSRAPSRKQSETKNKKKKAKKRKKSYKKLSKIYKRLFS